MAADAEDLFTAHHQRLFRYLYRAVGHVDEARDLTQDLFVRVTRASVPQAGDSDLRAWLFSIARNLVLDHHKAARRRPIQASMPVNGRVASQETAAAVNQALAALPPLDRDVLLLREVSGLTYEEIARVCELTPDAVRSRIHRTRLDLRGRLAAPIAVLRASGSDRFKEDE